MTDTFLTQADYPTPALATDDVSVAARHLGLKPVRAWVSDDQKPRTSVAKRTKRSREKAEMLGYKQLSITLQTELHPFVRTLAARTKAGEPADAVLSDLLPCGHTTSRVGHTSEPVDCLSRIPSLLKELPAWRRWLVQLLLAPLLRQKVS